MLFGMERARVCAFSLQSFHNLIIYIKDTIQKRHAVFFSIGMHVSNNLQGKTVFKNHC